MGKSFEIRCDALRATRERSLAWACLVMLAHAGLWKGPTPTPGH